MKSENLLLNKFSDNSFNHELFFPLPEGLLDFEDFLSQTEAVELDDYEEACLEEDDDEFLEEDDDEFFLYDDDSSFYTVFKDFYEPFSLHKLKSSQLYNFISLKSKLPDAVDVEPLEAGEIFDLFFRIGFSFF